MIVPTGITLANYWNALKSDCPTEIQMVFTGQNVTLDSSDIDISGVTNNDILNGETDITFGKAVSKQLTTTVILSDKTKKLDWTGEFQLKFGVKPTGSNSFSYVTVGYFHGGRPKNITSMSAVQFTAYDRMTRFDVSANGFLNVVHYPITVEDFYYALCDYVGVGYETVGAENIWSREIQDAVFADREVTCRTILAKIAEASGRYARINASGNCDMVWFDDTYEDSYSVTGDEEFYIDHADMYDSITWDQFDALTLAQAEAKTWNEIGGSYEQDYMVNAIKIINSKQKYNSVYIYPQWFGQTSNVYVIEDNPFLWLNDLSSDVNDYIIPLYERLKDFGGRLPVRIECVGNWCVETGDIISVAVGEKTVKMPIYCRTMHWNGAIEDSYETTGNIERNKE